MFELDWRGDKTHESLQEFMSSNPIHVEGDNINSYGDITNEKVQERLRKACVPYVEETASKLLNFSA